MPAKFLRHAAVAALVLLLSACATEYTYTPPASAEGLACVRQCQATQNACQQDEARRASDAQAHCRHQATDRHTQCERDAQSEYTACLKFARTTQERNSCVKKTCHHDSCRFSPNTHHCDTAFRACYQQCGGRVGVLK